MTHILFEQPPDFGSFFRRGLRGGEPALDFRSEVVAGRDGGNLELRVAKESQQFAEWQRPNVRRVAQCFPAVLERSALRMLAGVNVLD